MKQDILDQLLKDREAKTAVALATALVSGEQALIYYDSATGQLAGSDAVVEAARSALRDDKSRIAQTPDGDIFVHVFNPPLRMILVGAVHIAQPLSRMATVAGYDVSVVDPRESFATPSFMNGPTTVSACSTPIDGRRWLP